MRAQADDQGLVNTDPRTIAVPNGWVNMVPTDVRGLTFDRTPQQVLNILFLGNPAGKGVFFPNGVYGAINKPVGYNLTAGGLDSFPATGAKVATQVRARLLHMLCSSFKPSYACAFYVMPVDPLQHVV